MSLGVRAKDNALKAALNTAIAENKPQIEAILKQGIKHPQFGRPADEVRHRAGQLSWHHAARRPSLA